MRAAVFIDGAYLLKFAQNSNIDLDFECLTEYFLKPIRTQIPVDVLRVYFYDCKPWSSPVPTEDEERRLKIHKELTDKLEALPRWQVRLGKLAKRRDGDKEYFEQKRVDVMLSCDLVRHAAAGHIQHALLVAGDSDFIPAVRAAKESGTTVTLWGGKDRTVHRDLTEMADEVHALEPKKIRIPKSDTKETSKTEPKKKPPQPNQKKSKQPKKSSSKPKKENSRSTSTKKKT